MVLDSIIGLLPHLLWSGLDVCCNRPRLTHLQYVDDTLLLCAPNLDYLLNIKKSLILFQLVSGFQVNFHKSSIISINVEESWLLETAKVASLQNWFSTIHIPWAPY